VFLGQGQLQQLVGKLRSVEYVNLFGEKCLCAVSK